MANSLYDFGRQCFLDGGISWTSHNIKVILIDTGNYTVNLSSHQYLSDIPSNARIATSSVLTGKSSTAGVADASDVLFPTVTGQSCEALVIYRDTGTESTSQLIAYIDSADGLPVSPDGTDIPITWDNGTNKIFKL